MKQRKTSPGSVILAPDLEKEVTAWFLEGVEPLERAGKFGELLLPMTPGFAPPISDLTVPEPLLRQAQGKSTHPRRVVLELWYHVWLEDRHQDKTVAFLREQGGT